MKLKDLENAPIGLYDVKAQFRDYVYRRSVEAFARGDKARDDIQDTTQLAARRTYMRTKLLENIGGLPALDTPLNPKRTGVVKCDGFTIENIIYESRPGTYVTANLYLPDGIVAPQGAVLHVLGHSAEAKFKPLYQTVCQCLVRAGLIVLVFDPIGQGERLSYYEPSTETTEVPPGVADHEQAGVQCWPLGQGAVRYFIHDSMRALDYLCSRSEVDPTKIGITGCSGGGTQTTLMMLCDERIAAAAPSAFLTSREAKMYSGRPQDAEQIWLGMSELGLDHEDLLLAFAPKPLLVLAATGDFFPIEGTHRTVRRSRRFWDWFGQSDNLQLYEESCPHTFSEGMAKAAAVFFAKHLLEKEVGMDEVQLSMLDIPQLCCTASGQIRGDYPQARAIFEENSDRLLELEQQRAKLPEIERTQRAMEWLRRTVWAARDKGELNPRYLSSHVVDNENLLAKRVMWQSQQNLFNHAVVIHDCSHSEEGELPITLAVWEGGTGRLQSNLGWIHEVCAKGRQVMVLDMTGVGALSPHSLHPGNKLLDFYGTIHKLTMDLFWLNDSLAAIRTFDVLRALDMAQSLEGGLPNDIHVYAQGRYSIYAQLAAKLDDRVSSLEVEKGFGPVADWVRSRYYNRNDLHSLVLPGMLQYMDIE